MTSYIEWSNLLLKSRYGLDGTYGTFDRATTSQRRKYDSALRIGIERKCNSALRGGRDPTDGEGNAGIGLARF